MGISFTEEQQQVIDARDCSLLVSAAAGSGKTAVLVERILRLISEGEHPADIDRLLIVTFTNAAAVQMRERIRDALSSRLEQEPDNAHLQRQMTLLHNAQITTIHSFCLFVIRNNFNDIGLDPAFRVADEGELRLLRGEVMDALLEEHFAAQDEAFLACLESLNQNGDETSLGEQILRLYDFSRSYPFPKIWLEKAAQDYAPDNWQQAEKSLWAAFAKQDTERILSACACQMERALAVCEAPDGPYMYAPVLEAERKQLLDAAGKETLGQYAEAVDRIAFGRLPSKKDDSVSAEKRELVKGMRTEVKEALEALLKRYFFLPGEEQLSEIQGSGSMVKTLVSLTLEFGERLFSKKQEKNILDFGDMEHYALEILLTEQEDGSFSPSAAAKEYRSYFREIMVDEYQDSNLVQEYILQSISGEEDGCFNRFMVGDVKQSIYRFRLARPELFMEKYERYQEAGRERKIMLHRNFRSRSQVTESVNMVFSKIMHRELGGVEYDREAALSPAAVYPPCENAMTELCLLAEDKESGKSKIEQEAVLLARCIGSLMETHQVTDEKTGQLRHVRYGDIAILLRTNAGWDETLRSTLKAFGIPAHTASSTGYFSSEEIRTMLHFLRILDNPLQDIPLFGVLRSAIGAFTESEIGDLRAACREGTLYEAVKHRAEEAAQDVTAQDVTEQDVTAQDGLQQKCVRFLALLEKYRERVIYEPVRQLLREILEETGYMQYMTAFPQGEVRRANLEMLLRRAADFEQTGSHGLFGFIRYMEQLEKYDVDYGEAGTTDEYADVVRIMSIHKSKGLEFPICFVAGLAKRFNMQDQAKSLLMDVDYGIGCEYVDTEKRLRRTTLRRNAIARKQSMDSLGEELRILYVAMTRAKEKLIMTACIPEPEKKLEARGMEETKEGWRQIDNEVSYLALCRAGSLLDFLLPAWEPVSIRHWEDLQAEEIRTVVREAGRRKRLEEYEKEPYDENMQKLFLERFSYTYPWQALERLYTKTTVSELKMEKMTDVSEGASHLFETQRQEAYVPRFCRTEEKVSGAVRGSAVHHLMELLSFDTLPVSSSREELTCTVKTLLQELSGSGKLTEEEADCINPGKIADFLLTKEAKRMCRAAGRGLLYKEQPFMLGLPASRVDTAFPSGETVLIQGIIDVFWEEEDALVVLDYKTDYVTEPGELAERYKTQLDYYSEALERITGKKVKEKLIYSFHFNQILPL